MLNWRQIRALLLVITMAGLVPALILYTNRATLAWPPRPRLALAAAGLLLGAGGLVPEHDIEITGGWPPAYKLAGIVELSLGRTTKSLPAFTQEVENGSHVK